MFKHAKTWVSLAKELMKLAWVGAAVLSVFSWAGNGYWYALVVVWFIFWQAVAHAILDAFDTS